MLFQCMAYQLDSLFGRPIQRVLLYLAHPASTSLDPEQFVYLTTLGYVPAPNLLARITLSCPDKVQRKTPFLSPEIKTRPFRFVRLCVAPEVHLKKYGLDSIGRQPAAG